MLVSTPERKLLPYTLRAGYSGNYAGALINIDSDGNRVVPMPAAARPSPTSREIVLVGDSVVFCQGLDDEDTIAANIQRMLSETDPVRVVPIAAPGYTSWNEYTALRSYPRFAQIGTVLLVYVSNDLTTDNDHFKLGATGGRIHYLKMDLLHRVLRAAYANSRLLFLISDSLKKLIYMARSGSAATSEGVDRPALAYSLEAIGKTRDLCLASGKHLLVAIYRDGTYYSQPHAVEQYELAVSQGLQSIGVDNFTLTWATSRLPLAKFAVAWNDPSHPSAEATRILSEEIVEELRHRGY